MSNYAVTRFITLQLECFLFTESYIALNAYLSKYVFPFQFFIKQSWDFYYLSSSALLQIFSFFQSFLLPISLSYSHRYLSNPSKNPYFYTYFPFKKSYTTVYPLHGIILIPLSHTTILNPYPLYLFTNLIIHIHLLNHNFQTNACNKQGKYILCRQDSL